MCWGGDASTTTQGRRRAAAIQAARAWGSATVADSATHLPGSESGPIRVRSESRVRVILSESPVCGPATGVGARAPPPDRCGRPCVCCGAAVSVAVQQRLLRCNCVFVAGRQLCAYCRATVRLLRCNSASIAVQQCVYCGVGASIAAYQSIEEQWCVYWGAFVCLLRCNGVDS